MSFMSGWRHHYYNSSHHSFSPRDLLSPVFGVETDSAWVGWWLPWVYSALCVPGLMAVVGSNNKDKGCYQLHIKSSNQLMFLKCILYFLKNKNRSSLVVQRLRIHLPMQGTQVGSPAREDLTCHGADKPRHHNSCAHVPYLLKPTRL